jgi:AraC-like DNA-binding protein
VLYLEHRPSPPLRRFIRALWYTRATHAGHARERILPTGCVQLVMNLARDFLLDCPEGHPEQKGAPSAIVGARSVYEIVNTSDMADLIGIVFEPGGFPTFASEAADLFSNRNIDLEDVWGTSARSLRDDLREIREPQAKLCFFEGFLFDRFATRLLLPAPIRQSVVAFALDRFARAPLISSVRDVAQRTGWSERRFSQIFREEVGLSPKVWCRIQRFQRAVQQLHAGRDVPWPELALDCGYYDQSHFANEFRAFSGVDATTYSAHRTIWANHIPVG